MAKAIQLPYDFSISIPVQTAQSVQVNNDDPISLEALGLLINLLSYPNSWELHKLELYKRFGKNKKTSVMSAWDELVRTNYIIQYRYRVGRKDEYVYYYRKVPFTPEEKAQILDTARVEHSENWSSDFRIPKKGFPKSACNQKNLLNKNTLLNINNNNLDKLDDDKRKIFARHNEDQINVIISSLRESTKEELSERSFKSIVHKVVDKYIQGKIGEGKFRDYLVTALINKIEQLEMRKAKEKKIEKPNRDYSKLENKLRKESVLNGVIYNWLEQ
jgi:hypothetical protein